MTLDHSLEGTERLLPERPDLVERSGAAQLLIVAADGTWTARSLPASGALTIGRDACADLCLDERAVSRLHARLELHEGELRLIDLGSANGTMVAGRLVRDAAVTVREGEPIVVGRTVLTLQAPRPKSATRPRAEAPLGAGRAMTEVNALIARAAPTLISVLLVGETGAGKDVAAERLHQLSTRATGPLVRINCAGLSAALLESELFGHERGAFTGAAQAKPGLLEVAAGGTVFLDEIGEMPLEVQAKLLLAIEQRVVRRVGSNRSEPIDVRFVSATHRDLEAEIRRDRFRADFYYRINGLTIALPPLRARCDELDGLVAQLARDAAARMERARAPRFDGPALARLHRHDWPGNVRELRSVVERAVLLTDGDVVDARCLTAAGLPGEGQPAIDAAIDAAAPSPIPSPAPVTAEERERHRVITALAECGGNQSRAARALGISRNTLIARIRQYGLARPHRQDALR